MISESDYPARGWSVMDCYSHLLPSGLFERMASHAESAGLSSVGTRNLLHSFTLAMKPKIVLEVGAHIGNGAVAIGSALKRNNFGHLYSLEPQTHYFDLISDFVRQAELSEYVSPLKLFSTDNSLSSVLGEPVDLIYLDANHSYTYVEKDLSICEKLLSKNGVILLDDVGVHHSANIDSERRGGVRQALLDFVAKRQNWGVVFLEHPYWLNPCGIAIASRR